MKSPNRLNAVNVINQSPNQFSIYLTSIDNKRSINNTRKNKNNFKG